MVAAVAAAVQAEKCSPAVLGAAAAVTAVTEILLGFMALLVPMLVVGVVAGALFRAWGTRC
jgi:uncharacterized membrane protein